MPDYFRKVESVSDLVKANKSVFVNSPSGVLETAPQISLDKQVMRIIDCPVISEKYYLRGEQQPYNTFYKNAPTVHLRGDGANGEITTTSQPMYRLRREAFKRLHSERKDMLENGIDSFMQYRGLSWKPSGSDSITRIITFTDAVRSVVEFLLAYYSGKDKDKIELIKKYGNERYGNKGATIFFGMPSITGKGGYSPEKNALHSVAVYTDKDMILTNAQIYSTHNCGKKQNMMTSFKGSTKRVEILDFHDGKAHLEHLLQSMEAMRRGENVDAIYDPVERTRATIPMYLNWLPLATPEELKLFKVLAYNTTIKRPKRDRQNGGFLRDGSGNIIYNKETPLWEAEIEAILATKIAEMSEKAMFIRQKIVELPFFQKE